MKIQIREDRREHTLIIPNGVIFNALTVHIACAAVGKYAPNAAEKISSETMRRLFAELKQIHKTHGAWELVEVQSADGEHVKITL